MRAEIENAIKIADAYRNEFDGELPVLVITHNEEGEQNVYVGIFRDHKNHTANDMKMFCSVMRMAFSINKVTSYELLVKPQFNYTAAQMTKNVLAVVAVTADSKSVEWFEIEDDALLPYFSEMPVEGMYTQLLPKSFVEVDAKVASGIQNYLEACSYTVPNFTETADETEEDSAFSALVNAFG